MTTTIDPPGAPPLLALDNVQAAYDGIIVALRGVSLLVAPGTIVALLGANGAGKTTTLKAASALLAAERGAVTGGTIRYQGRDTAAAAPRDLVRAGLVQVLEGRHCFPHLTVDENLRAGALGRGAGLQARRLLRGDLEQIYTYFPRLTLRRRAAAGLLSGGEQQMVAIGRALMARPTLVLLDEPSMGLAPLIVEEIFSIIRTLNRQQGVSFLLAEQNARLALRHADHGYVLENGRVVASGTAAQLEARADVQAFYLGVGGADGGRAASALTS
ncbi:MAG: branched-chain amino acid transport system ATP-binding protein [Myxococcales bacterium]|jgi:branched-chain amino acid transport system ATP-binding protein|nr:branched-chain amino acid transport system ATP-binding protein [Myxococcales bacterium]